MIYNNQSRDVFPLFTMHRGSLTGKTVDVFGQWQPRAFPEAFPKVFPEAFAKTSPKAFPKVLIEAFPQAFPKHSPRRSLRNSLRRFPRHSPKRSLRNSRRYSSRHSPRHSRGISGAPSLFLYFPLFLYVQCQLNLTGATSIMPLTFFIVQLILSMSILLFCKT